MLGDGVVAARPSDLSRVYRVAGRIEHASEQRGCRRQLELVLSETAKAWANLTAFVANSPTRVSPAPGRVPGCSGSGLADSSAVGQQLPCSAAQRV